jgi:hypothetical protein
MATGPKIVYAVCIYHPDAKEQCFENLAEEDFSAEYVKKIMGEGPYRVYRGDYRKYIYILDNHSDQPFNSCATNFIKHEQIDAFYGPVMSVEGQLGDKLRDHEMFVPGMDLSSPSPPKTYFVWVGDPHGEGEFVEMPSKADRFAEINAQEYDEHGEAILDNTDSHNDDTSE